MHSVRLSVSISVVALALASGATAQTTYPSPYVTTASPYTALPPSDADLLAAQIRLLAIDPRNLQALVRAGELALKLDDDTAAGAFFARAERIDPNNARVKAGEGSLLVAGERPGEALQRFALAERLGGDPRSFAADRGLAYDLIGEQDRAQRDYRLALRAGPNDETQRRYALSLGISGKRELALVQIDPLLRKSDRGAWRSRAFILAMGGDKAGAEKIATTMMPAGMAQGLQPFFDILPSLRPADRAFAVHFGEVRATPERIADARLVPPLATLGPDPTAPVAVVVASVVKPVVVADARQERRREREARKSRGRTLAIAATQPPPQPLPAPPAYVAQTETGVVLASNTTRLPTSSYSAPSYPAPRPTPTPPSSNFVQRVAPTIPVNSVALPPHRAGFAPAPSLPPASIAPRVQSVASGASTVTSPASSAAEASIPTVRTLSAPANQPAAAAISVGRPPAVIAAAPVIRPTISAPMLAAAAEPSTVVSATPTQPIAPTPVRSEDAILAAIISDIKVPGSELPPEPPTVAPQRAPEIARPIADDAAMARRAEAERALADKAAADQKLADKKAIDKKALADKKVADGKKAAADKKVADAKKAAEEKRKNDPKILEPARVWVQVAGGANENDLPKQWAKLRSGHAKAFAGKSGWTTPLRATNRILTGPFKSEDEAQSFVNGLAKDGLSGFVFTSEAGQKITKLATK